MNTMNRLILAATVLTLASCDSPAPEKTADANASATDTSGTVSVETKKPNSDYKPAFAGQTRIAAVKSKTAYEGKVLTSDLKNPWGVTSLPDGRLIITEKMGTIRIASTTGTLTAPITGVPKVNPDNQGGLLGIAVDPAFTQNRMLYWVFSEKLPDGNITA
ncbi:MAG: PQQ-dependent sugar dehydrogenase, partial [Chitinophagaceae bacterium]